MDRMVFVYRDTLSCEAIVRRAPDGHLIIVSQCGGVNEPEIGNRTYAFHSNDEGLTWSKGELIYPDNGRATGITGLECDNGHIDAFITEHNGSFLYPDCHIRRSFDNGHTWAKVPMPIFRNTFVFLRGKVCLADGRTAFCYQQYDLKKEECDRLDKDGKIICDADLPYADCGLIIREKDGSFVKSEDIRIKNEFNGKRLWQWPEPTAAVLADGTIVMLFRINGSGFLYESRSHDGIKWTPLEKTDIPNPNNKPKLVDLKNGEIALLNTPGNGVGFKYRTPLEIWISDDGMKTWYYKKRITDFPGWLSYPDGFYERTTDEILFTFELNRHDIYFVRADISDRKNIK